MKNILVVDDEADILELVSMNLEANGFGVLHAMDGEAALEIARSSKPDLMILDIMMPKLDGYQVLEQLRKDSRIQNTPVLMLTAKGELTDRISGLEQGADDYLSKPFSPKELVLRVQNLLKRTQPRGSEAILQSGDFVLDRNGLRLRLAGQSVDLTATEFKLLRILIEGNGEPMDRDLLLREVWGYSDHALTRTLDTHIKRLREKLGSHADHIQTIRSVGYRFVANLGR
jgi:two-component system, OmpR family, phosphate regulon response regulator PhoB